MTITASVRRKRKPRPNLRFENEAGCLVCGVDEVGCAPLAGPVVAAAVILPAKALPRKLVALINDSKIVPAPKREAVAAALPELLRHQLRRGERRRDRYAQHLPRAHARHVPRNRGPQRRARPRAHRRQRETEGRHLLDTHRGRRRREVPVDRRRLHRRESFPRCVHAQARGRIPRLRLGDERRLRHARSSQRHGAARAHARTTAAASRPCASFWACRSSPATSSRPNTDENGN